MSEVSTPAVVEHANGTANGVAHEHEPTIGGNLGVMLVSEADVTELEKIAQAVMRSAQAAPTPTKESQALANFMQTSTPPSSEEEAVALTIDALGRDPNRIRAMGAEMAAKWEQMAKAIEESTGVATPAAAVEPMPVAAPTPSVAAATPAPGQKPIAPTHPLGFLPLAEMVYSWAPDMWGGLPLHCIPLKASKRENQATLIYVVTTEPCYGRNRVGRIVKLPPGSRLVVHATIAWGPVLATLTGPLGRPVLYVVPVHRDTSGPIPILRPAARGEELYKFETGDGGYEYGVEISYDPDPTDPQSPRLISMETIQGGMAEQEARGAK